MNASEAKSQSQLNYQEKVKKQIEWVDLKIKNAVSKGKDCVEGYDETLYPETILHFQSLGYMAKNDFFSAWMGGSMSMACMDSSFSYWHISWKEEVKE